MLVVGQETPPMAPVQELGFEMLAGMRDLLAQSIPNAVVLYAWKPGLLTRYLGLTVAWSGT